MGVSRIQIAGPAIYQYFDNHLTRIFKPTDIGDILSDRRTEWVLTKSTGVRDFARFLMEEGKLRLHDFPFPYRHESRYTWGEMPLLEILLTLKPHSYFSHATAMQLHKLTVAHPTRVFLNHEQRPQPKDTNLEQGRIDAAFKRKARESNNSIEYGETNICMLNGMYTNQLGVSESRIDYANEKVTVRVTNLERTLIDIAVRPVYAGGVQEVKSAFLLAKGKVNVRLMAEMLQKLSYVYPYNQSIGYYLEQAGYENQDLDLFRQYPLEFDFYLAHQMDEADYIKAWKIYVPKP